MNDRQQIKLILSTVAADEMALVGPTLIDEIIENELEKKEINFQNPEGGYNLDVSDLIIKSVSTIVSMISLLISYWNYKKDQVKDKSPKEVDELIIRKNPEYLSIELKSRQVIIKLIEENNTEKNG